MSDKVLNQHHGKGKDRKKRESGTYYAIANGKMGKLDISKGDTVKLTEKEASGLSEILITEKEAKGLINKAAKGMTTKSISGE